MQALIRTTSKLRFLITNQAVVLRSDALFSSSFFPGGRDFEMGRNIRSLDNSEGGRDFEMGRNFRSLDNSEGGKDFEIRRNFRSLDNSEGGRDFEMGRNFRSFGNWEGGRDFETGRNFGPMSFVRGIVERDGRGIPGSAQLPQYAVERNPDVVHVKLIHNNTFVTVTDSKGNKKIGASAGCLKGIKGGAKADAIAEHAGRLASNFGLKAVIVKVNGYTFFKKKRQAILGWKEGFAASGGGENSIVYIEDTTRLPHNGCRLPRPRRIKKRKHK